METKNNDQKILELKKKIEEKKVLLGKSQKFTPITNCSIEIDGTRHNIQALPKEQLILLLFKLNAYAMAAKDLDMLSSCCISGFNVQDWISDLKSKLDFVNRKEEESKLRTMETKLSQLLSEEKKVELEIDEIENLLK